MFYSRLPLRTYLWDEEDEQAGHSGANDHEHRQHIGSIDEEVHSQHQTERGPDAHHDHHYVHGNADEARVVDVDVFDVAALVGQEQAKHDQQALVDVQCSDQVAKVVALALLVK